MFPCLTSKSQVTIPKSIREWLGVGPGERIRFEPLADGRVAIAPLEPKKAKKKRVDPFDAMIGSSTTPGTTDEIMRLTRGSDWNKA